MAQDGGVIQGRVTTQAEARPWSWDRAAILLLVLNLLDALFTLTFIELGWAQEANPVMRFAYELSPLTFVAVKLLTVNMGVLILSRYRDSPMAHVALKMGLALYVVIVTWHLAFLSYVVLHRAT